MAVSDPTQPSIADALLPMVTPVVQQAVTAASAETLARLAALEAQLAVTATATVSQLQPAVLVAGRSVLGDLEHDVTTQRVLLWGIAGAVLVGALVVLVAALLGNHTAQDYSAKALGAVGALILWFSNSGVSLPKRPAVAKGG